MSPTHRPQLGGHSSEHAWNCRGGFGGGGAGLGAGLGATLRRSRKSSGAAPCQRRRAQRTDLRATAALPRQYRAKSERRRCRRAAVMSAGVRERALGASSASSLQARVLWTGTGPQQGRTGRRKGRKSSCVSGGLEQSGEAEPPLLFSES